MSINKKIAIGSVIVALVVSVICFASFLRAGSLAEEYEKSFASWNNNEKTQLLQLTSNLPQMYEFDYNTLTKENSLDMQKKGCDQIGATVKSIDEISSKLPKLPFAFLGTLNSKYAASQNSQDNRSKTVKQYSAESRDIFQKISADCKWNYGYNKDAEANHAEYEKAQSFLMKPGESANGKTCPASSTSGCRPTEPDKKNSYVEAYREFVQKRRANSEKWWKDDACGKTSYGSDTCKKIMAAELAYSSADRELIDTYALNPSDNSAIDAKAQKREEATKAGDEAVVARYKHLFPSIEITKQLSDAPSSSDAFVDAVAKARIASHTSHQRSLKDLR